MPSNPLTEESVSLGRKHRYALSASRQAEILQALPFLRSASELEDPSPAYAKARAEGLSLSQARWWDYLRKYKSKKVSAPRAVVSYFEAQRRIQFPMTQEPVLDSDIHLGFVGDVMWIRTGWNDFLDPRLKNHLAQYDLLVGNLETPIARTHRVPRILPDVRSFNSPPELLTSFTHPREERNLFSALSVANNHSLDQGAQGAYETLDFLREQHVPYSGMRKLPASERAWIVLETRGLRIGYYATTWGLNDTTRLRSPGLEVSHLPGIAPLGERAVDTSEIEAVLAEMKAEKIDFKIVSAHWGHEFEFYPDPAIMAVGRRIVQAGADLILGSHPHVIQPNEVCFVNGAEDDAPPEAGCHLTSPDGVKRKALIVYSLGNFLTAMYTPECEIGVIESLRLRRDPGNGQVTWHRPETQTVYNVRSHPKLGKRRLMRIEDLLADLKTTDRRSLQRVERVYRFQRGHLGW
jgi:poly-gamma-glutamate capsule biosynthesis protein CapA/YwtB (metallophosphatase superfamily)